MRVAILVAAMIMGMSVTAGCARNDCHRLADLVCQTEGVTPEDCRKSRESARTSKTSQEKETCSKWLESFQKSQQ